MKLIAFFSFLLTTTTVLFAQQPPIGESVSPALAKWRAANYSDVRYKVNLTLEKGASLMRGDIEIRVKLTEEAAKSDLILDWRTMPFLNDKDKSFASVSAVNDSDISLNSKEFSASVRDEHLVISSQCLKKGENVIKINFASPIKTSGAAITRYIDTTDGAEYVYARFAPGEASAAFPCFDQPDLKARFKFELSMPWAWKAVSNAKSKEFFANVNGRGTTYSFSLADFEETKPISTELFAFAAGEFEVFYEKQSRNPLKNFGTIAGSSRKNLLYNLYGSTIYVRKSQAGKFKQYAKEAFRLNPKNEASEKFDIILLPEISNIQTEYNGIKFVAEGEIFK